ncbi:MAG TPA: hypothetical protein VF188_10345 [Longimicrobiales bacterium]
MRRPLAFVLVLAATAPPAAAQSIFASEGLGVPVAPLDARARALGGIGVGLLGPNASLVNPAAAVEYLLRGATAGYQSSDRSIDLDGAQGDAGSSRFPLLHVLYPIGQSVVASAGYGSFLDQSWAVFSQRQAILGSDTLTVRDLIDSEGAIAQLRIGAGYRLTSTLAVGAAAGLYTGHISRVVARSFPDSLGTDLRPVRNEAEWSQRAPLVAAGFRWDPAPILRLAGAVTWAGTLHGHADDPDVDDFDIDLPLQVTAGASALLTPGVLAAVSGRWAGWSDASGDTDFIGSADDAWEIGAGLELGGDPRAGTGFPIRLGYHYERFPFRFGSQVPTEWSAALGFGTRFVPTDAGPLASIDAVLERGGRTANGSGLSEDFWRFTLSIAAFAP